MKNLTLITFLFYGLFCKAQQSELIENTWYLNEINIEGIPNTTPDVQGVPIDYETAISQNSQGTTINIMTQGCNNIIFEAGNTSENSFNISDASLSMEECQYGSNYENFDNLYYNLFANYISETFQYLISNNTDGTKVLVITNPDGDKAIYGNENLSTSEISASNQDKFQLAFQNDDLLIKSSESVAESISIYDLNGKLILESQVYNNKISTSQLTKGIYIVKIKDGQGKIFSEKVLKE